MGAAAATDDTNSEDTADDHGDTAATATSVEAPSETEGELTAGDVDYFSFTLDSGADVTVTTTGDTDTTGTLEDSDGESVASDEDSGDGDNFSVTQRLAAGTYKVKVEGAESSTAGEYTLDVDSIPVVEVAVTEMPMTVESTTDDYFVLYVKHTEHSLLPVRVFRGEADETTISEVLAPLAVSEYRLDKFKVATPADVDGDGIDDITELDSLGDMNPINAAQINKLSADSVSHHGQTAIPDRQTFELLAYKDELLIGFETFPIENLKFSTLSMAVTYISTFRTQIPIAVIVTFSIIKSSTVSASSAILPRGLSPFTLM